MSAAELLCPFQGMDLLPGLGAVGGDLGPRHRGPQPCILLGPCLEPHGQRVSMPKRGQERAPLCPALKPLPAPAPLPSCSHPAPALLPRPGDLALAGMAAGTWGSHGAHARAAAVGEWCRASGGRGRAPAAAPEALASIGCPGPVPASLRHRWLTPSAGLGNPI